MTNAKRTPTNTEGVIQTMQRASACRWGMQMRAGMVTEVAGRYADGDWAGHLLALRQINGRDVPQHRVPGNFSNIPIALG